MMRAHGHCRALIPRRKISMQTKADTFTILEERIENLISHLERVHRANEELRQRNAALENQSGELKTLREANQKLTAQVDKLETELLSMAEKEDQIRDRLQSIV